MNDAKKKWRYALIVVDMLRDNIETQEHSAIATEARKIIPNIKKLIAYARQEKMPVIYACDSFLEGDLLFQGRMQPHALRGTEGAQVIDELRPAAGEMVLEKRSMSAFFRTDLDLTLRTFGVDGILVTGISTAVCVLLTAFDAVASGFRAVIVEDCCAAHKPEVHDTVLNLYRKSGIYPVLKVANLEELLS